MSKVEGFSVLHGKKSAVDRRGHLQQLRIAGLEFRATRPVPHEDGHVTEVAREDWDIVGAPCVQVHTTTTFAGRIRAWGLHERSTDRLFVVSGLIKIVVFDGRSDSPTKGVVNEFALSDRNPGLLVIPPNLYHGWKNIGTVEAVIINMPSMMYNHEDPDALDLPWNSAEARALIPYCFANPLI